jgi:hypothetical protein
MAQTPTSVELFAIPASHLSREWTDLTYWDAGKQTFVVEPGRLSIIVGASSADVRLEKTIEVKEK